MKAKVNEGLPTKSDPRVFMKKEMTARGLTAETMAKQIGVAFTICDQVLNLNMPITIELALAIEKHRGLEAEMWLNWQTGYQLSQARQAMSLERPKTSKVKNS